MSSVTLSRGGTSIDIPLLAESGTELLTSTFGKPEVQVRSSGGTLDPRIVDQWSGLQTFTLAGQLFDYDKARELADLVKSADTEPLTLAIPLDEYPDTVSVAPAASQDSALTLTFPSGRTDQVDVSLSLTRVGQTLGSLTQQATTPTDTGSGPVELEISGTTVELPTAGLSLERTVGRPNDVVRRQPGVSDPRYIIKPKVTSDVFTFSFETVENIPSTLNTITDNIFRARLGRRGVTIRFNGVFGLGEIEALPIGSSPFRQIRQAGRGWVVNPELSFRRIFSPG
jgi:hypothetical protein